MRLRVWVPIVLGLAVAAALPGASRPAMAAPLADIPPWLWTHVGPGEGQIAAVVLRRARAHYYRKRRQGAVKNPCYFAKDATRPAGQGRRFYVICEANQLFWAVSSGHGNGRSLKKIPNFSNGARCAKNFSNALHSRLTTGGAYVTAEIRTSFRGYYRNARGQVVPLMRSFVQFEGEGETANARLRAIGGHPAVIVTPVCRMKAPNSPYADGDGYVPYGKLKNYSAGRSHGCTTWTPSDSEQIVAMVRNRPTTLYIYPESRDIVAVARAVKAGRAPARLGLYWNASCLREIGAPNFWPRETLEPALVEHEEESSPSTRSPLPVCKGLPSLSASLSAR